MLSSILLSFLTIYRRLYNNCSFVKFLHLHPILIHPTLIISIPSSRKQTPSINIINIISRYKPSYCSIILYKNLHCIIKLAKQIIIKITPKIISITFILQNFGIFYEYQIICIFFFHSLFAECSADIITLTIL